MAGPLTVTLSEVQRAAVCRALYRRAAWLLIDGKSDELEVVLDLLRTLDPAPVTPPVTKPEPG